MGVESGSQKILDAMDKGTRVEQAREATRLLRSHGIRPALVPPARLSGRDVGRTSSRRADSCQDERPRTSASRSRIPSPAPRSTSGSVGRWAARTNWTDERRSRGDVRRDVRAVLLPTRPRPPSRRGRRLPAALLARARRSTPPGRARDVEAGFRTALDVSRPTRRRSASRPSDGRRAVLDLHRRSPPPSAPSTRSPRRLRRRDSAVDVRRRPAPRRPPRAHRGVSARLPSSRARRRGTERTRSSSRPRTECPRHGWGPAMVERTRRKAAEAGLGDRVRRRSSPRGVCRSWPPARAKARRLRRRVLELRVAQLRHRPSAAGGPSRLFSPPAAASFSSSSARALRARSSRSSAQAATSRLPALLARPCRRAAWEGETFIVTYPRPRDFARLSLPRSGSGASSASAFSSRRARRSRRSRRSPRRRSARGGARPRRGAPARTPRRPRSPRFRTEGAA